MSIHQRNVKYLQTSQSHRGILWIILHRKTHSFGPPSESSPAISSQSPPAVAPKCVILIIQHTLNRVPSRTALSSYRSHRTHSFSGRHVAAQLSVIDSIIAPCSFDLNKDRCECLYEIRHDSTNFLRCRHVLSEHEKSDGNISSPLGWLTDIN